MNTNGNLQAADSRGQSNYEADGLNIVLANDQFVGSLHLLELNNEDSGEVVVRKIRYLYYHRLTTRWTRFWVHGIFCRRVIIETAFLDVNGLVPEVLHFVLIPPKF